MRLSVHNGEFGKSGKPAVSPTEGAFVYQGSVSEMVASSVRGMGTVGNSVAVDQPLVLGPALNSGKPSMK